MFAPSTLFLFMVQTSTENARSTISLEKFKGFNIAESEKLLSQINLSTENIQTIRTSKILCS